MEAEKWAAASESVGRGGERGQHDHQSEPNATKAFLALRKHRQANLWLQDEQTRTQEESPPPAHTSLSFKAP